MITFDEIKTRFPERCGEGIKWLSENWPEDSPTWTIADALEAGCVINDAIWLAARWDEKHLLVIRTWVLDYAERMLPRFEEKFPDDERPWKAIWAARKALQGKATGEELSDARSAAWAAADETRSAAWAAVTKDFDAYTGDTACRTTREAYFAARDAATYAYFAARAAVASIDATYNTARALSNANATNASERRMQRRHLIKLLREAVV
jgi:hypothetical protein